MNQLSIYHKPGALTATAPLPATDEQYQLLDMREVWEELAAALHHIQNLPHRYPDDVGEHPLQPNPAGTESDRPDGNANANTNTNFGSHAPIRPPNT